MTRLVLVGTGTDVGKTHVTACLALAARSRGLRVSAYKPVATGFTGVCEDAQVHADATGAPYVAPTFTYARPVSPHLAAREEGRPIDLEVVRCRAGELAVSVDVQLVETAGGLFSPLAAGPAAITNLDLWRVLAPALVILVAPDRIGVLHDVSATVLAARALGMPLPRIVLSAPSAPDASTGENAREIEALGFGPVLATFPRTAPRADESVRAAGAVWDVALPRAVAAR